LASEVGKAQSKESRKALGGLLGEGSCPFASYIVQWGPMQARRRDGTWCIWSNCSRPWEVYTTL
jgi:hypothetical protein